MADASTQGPSAVVNQLKDLWGNQSRGRKMLAMLVVLGIIGAVVFTRFVKTEAGWVVVADGASPDDSQEMMATLEQRGMPVRLTAGKVEVRSDKVDQARAIAAAAGLPRVGKGFELFDGSHLGQSSFAEQVNFRRGLQGELARSITSMAQVQGARVHLALGKRSVFKDRDEAATASVALHLHANQQLTAEQVRGIRQLVAASVEGLRPDAVVVVDNHGNLLDGAEPTAANKSAAIELATTSRVRQILERVVGAGKVNVVTTAVVDDSQISETQEVYDNTNPVLRSESRTVDGPGALDSTTLNGVGGVAGTRGNLPGATPAAGATGAAPNTANGRLQETKNFEISRTVRQVKKPDAQLTRLYLAVIVDYKTGANGKPEPRSDKELAELTALARQAAGIDDARGDKMDLRSIAFVADEAPAADVSPVAKPADSLLPVPLPVAIGAGAGLLVLIALVVILRNKKKAKKPVAKSMTLALPVPVADIERALDAKTSDESEAEALARQLPSLGAKEPAALPGQTTRDRVLAAVKTDVDRAAEVLTAWLSEPPAKTPVAANKGARA